MANDKKLRFLAVSASLLLFRYAMAKLISTSRPSETPEILASTETYLLKCPSGNIIHVEFDGLEHGQPLVLLHGLNSNSLQWFYQRKFFLDKYKLIFVDLPGHGKSAMPRSIAISSIAGDLAYILDYLRIEDPIIYGHSMGAMVAMEYCINHPEAKTRGMVLQHTTHTNVLYTNSLSKILAPLERSFIIPFLKFSLKNHRLIWLLSLGNYLNGLSVLFYRFLYFTGRQTSAQFEFKSRLAVLTSPKTVALALLELIQLNLTDRIKSIKVPSLIIAAYSDRLTTVEANEYIHSQIKESQLRYIKTGHFSLFENSFEVNRAVHNFIENLRPVRENIVEDAG
jgi:pimeloyl-ACP methyl ester carboxylesterase